jgi:mRNA interferase MazF
MKGVEPVMDTKANQPNAERKIRRGDILHADLTPGAGSEQSGFRPVLIIQNNTGDKRSATVIAAAIASRTKHKADLPAHCPLKRQQVLGRD